MDGGARKKCPKGSRRDTRKKYENEHRCRLDSSPRRKFTKKSRHTFFGSPYKSPEKRLNTHMFFPEGTYVMPTRIGSPDRLFSPKPITKAQELAMLDSLRGSYRSAMKGPAMREGRPRRSAQATRRPDYLGSRIFYGGDADV
jgi:hypothetical protein